MVAVVGVVTAAAAAAGGLFVDEDRRAELLVVAVVGLADVADTVDEDVVDFVLDLSSVFALVSAASLLTADDEAAFSLVGAGFGAGGGRVIISTMNFFSSILYSDSLLSSANILPE